MGRPYDQAKVDRVRRLVATYGVCAAAEIAKVSENGVRLMRNRGWTVGQGGPAKRPVPNDYRIQAAHMSVHELRDHYRAGISTIMRWSAETGRQYLAPRVSRAKPVPIDLAAKVKQLGTTAAAIHFGVSDDTMLKWRRAAGMPVRGEAAARPVWRMAA